MASQSHHYHHTMDQSIETKGLCLGGFALQSWAKLKFCLNATGVVHNTQSSMLPPKRLQWILILFAFCLQRSAVKHGAKWGVRTWLVCCGIERAPPRVPTVIRRTKKPRGIYDTPQGISKKNRHYGKTPQLHLLVVQINWVDRGNFGGMIILPSKITSTCF